jgi:hypothetical protein
MFNISSINSSQPNQSPPLSIGNSSGNPASAGAGSTNSQGLPQGQDSVSISDQGKALSGQNATNGQSATNSQSTPGSPSPSGGKQSASQDKRAKDARDQQIIQELKRRDADVRAHEEAHLATAGQLAKSGINYIYETGPDGVQYAVGGDVQIDTSDAGTPEATIRKMETVIRAALAPVDPSAEDRQVAAEAMAKELQAMQQLQEQQSEKMHSGSTSQSSTNSKGSSSSNSQGTSNTSNTSSTGSTNQQRIQAYQNIQSSA